MDPIQIITLGGAAGMAYFVLKWLVDGKLHTHSEVEGLRQDKAELWAANKLLAEANAEANKGINEILTLLQSEGKEGAA